MRLHEVSRPAASDAPVHRQAQSLALLVGVCVAWALGLVFARSAFTRPEQDVAARETERINPNDASVASLARLPGVGLTRARAIVAYRNESARRPGQGPAFSQADDLQRVKGIGPAIVEEIRPWLDFRVPAEQREPVAPGP